MRAALDPRVAAPASASALIPAQPRGVARVCAARSPSTAARRVASSERRLSVAIPRGVSPRPHAVAYPTSSVIARRARGRDVSSRASSLAGWTHGFGDANASDGSGDAAFVDDALDDEARRSAPTLTPTRALDDAASPALAPFESFVACLRASFVSTAVTAVIEARAKRASSAARRMLFTCAASFATALLAQHVFTWPGLAAVAPAAAFATGNLGSGAFVVSALTEAAACVASAASQTVSLATAVATGAATGALGYAAAAESAAAEMRVLRAEIAELRVAVAAAAAAARETTSTETPVPDPARLREHADAACGLRSSPRVVDEVPAAPRAAAPAAAATAVARAARATPSRPDARTAEASCRPAAHAMPATSGSGVEPGGGALAFSLENARSLRVREHGDVLADDAARSAELADLRAQLARLRATRAPDPAPRAAAGGAPAVDWNARARANAVWSPPSAAPDAARLGTARVPAEPGARGRADREAETEAATRRALAAARAELRALRASGDLTPPGSLEAHAPVTGAPADDAAIAKARALWSPGAPGAAPAAGGGAAAATSGASLPGSRARTRPPARPRAAGAAEEAAETARLEAEDREWRRRLRMAAESDDPFGDAQ